MDHTLLLVVLIVVVLALLGGGGYHAGWYGSAPTVQPGTATPTGLGGGYGIVGIVVAVVVIGLLLRLLHLL